MKRTKITHEFVDVVPDHLEEGVVYISLTYNTALHKCCCGCGNEVVTPISPVDWTLGYDGQAVTLKPSIGNYSFACQSHYWITRGKVDWVPLPSSQRIAEDRRADRLKRIEYFEGDENQRLEKVGEPSEAVRGEINSSWWKRTLARLKI